MILRSFCISPPHLWITLWVTAAAGAAKRLILACFADILPGFAAAADSSKINNLAMTAENSMMRRNRVGGFV